MVFRNILPRKKEEKSIDINRGLTLEDPIYEIDQWMDRFFEDPFFGIEKSLTAYKPNADMSETDDEYTVCLDLPGFDEKNLDVLIQNNNLTIRGSKEESVEEKHRHYHRLERKSGTFQRSFYLPDEIDETKIDAKYKNGVLTIHMPKISAGQTKLKKIPVKSK